MNARIIKGILGWNVVITLLLLLSVAANANLAQAAGDPPVKVFSNHADLNGGAVDQTDGDWVINAIGSDEQLAKVTVQLPAAKPHMCMAFVSAEAAHMSGNGVYRFALQLNDSTLPASVRRVELIDNAGIEDPKYKEVSSTAAWANLTGANEIRLVGAKTAGAAPDMKVTASSLTVICVKKILG